MTGDFMIKNIRLTSIITLGLSVALFFASCDKDMSISLKNESIDNLNLTSTDTLSTVVSTVLMPNIPTSGAGDTTTRILVGKVSQGPIGSLSSNAYIRLMPGNVSNDLPTSAKYDSITLVMRPSTGAYTHGDTTKTQTIVAHRVTQTLEQTTLNNTMTGLPNPIYISGAAIFGHQKFAYDATPLGSVTFLPHMNRRDSVSIRLSDAWGTELFNKIRTADYVFNSTANFQEYFKGLALVPAASNTAIVGFHNLVSVRIHYSYVGTDGFKKRGVKTLQTGDSRFQYNNFQADRTGTAFETLSTTKEIKSDASQGVSFIQAGNGVATKITIPGLAEFMQTQDIAINKAELVVEVASKEVGSFVAAPKPVLWIATDNIPTSFVTTPFANTIQEGAYIIGNNTGRNGRYVFNMIQYIRSANDENAKSKSLFLSVTPNELFNSANTSILATENNKPKIKLNIVYTKFK
ncbi:hypothetical protein GQF61_10630 [Sphingobacterium sp. DK4209]|nr:hypothetical protein [Sphingobacterium sp. DK4209]